MAPRPRTSDMRRASSTAWCIAIPPACRSSVSTRAISPETDATPHRSSAPISPWRTAHHQHGEDSVRRLRLPRVRPGAWRWVGWCGLGGAPAPPQASTNAFKRRGRAAMRAHRPHTYITRASHRPRDDRQQPVSVPTGAVQQPHEVPALEGPERHPSHTLALAQRREQLPQLGKACAAERATPRNHPPAAHTTHATPRHSQSASAVRQARVRCTRQPPSPAAPDAGGWQRVLAGSTHGCDASAHPEGPSAVVSGRCVRRLQGAPAAPARAPRSIECRRPHQAPQLALEVGATALLRPWAPPTRPVNVRSLVIGLTEGRQSRSQSTRRRLCGEKMAGDATMMCPAA